MKTSEGEGVPILLKWTALLHSKGRWYLNIKDTLTTFKKQVGPFQPNFELFKALIGEGIHINYKGHTLFQVEIIVN